MSRSTSSTICRPAVSATWARRESTAGIAAAAGERQPKSLGHAGHRRRSPHRHAVAVGARHRVLDLGEVGFGDPARAELLVVVPAIRARAELFPAPVTGEHRAAGYDDRRDVRRARAHDRCRVGLVTAGQQYDAVERVGADRLLDVHRHQVAVQHRRRLHQRLAEGHHRKLAREAAGLEHPALDRLREPAQVHVAVHELGPAVADPDHRPPAERVVADAGRLQPRAVQEPVQIVTVEPFGAAATVGVLVSTASHRRHVFPFGLRRSGRARGRSSRLCRAGRPSAARLPGIRPPGSDG